MKAELVKDLIKKQKQTVFSTKLTITYEQFP